MNRSKILLSVATLFLLSACIGPELFFGSVVGAGATLSKEKTVGSSLDDSNIWAKIKAAFLQNHKKIDGILTDVSVEVSEGRVLLTGTVASADDRLAILKIVWDQAGVREVINEIKLRESKEETGVKGYASDSWITTQVKSKMLVNKEIRSINYNVETIDAVVYILGISRSETELNQIKNIAESVKNVKKFVSYIRVREEHKVSAEPKEQFVPQEAHEQLKVKKEPKELKEIDDTEDDEQIIEIGQESE